MEIDRRTKNPHRTKATMDLIHIVICLAIVVLAVFAFAAPRENMHLFSAIFALAAVLNFLNGVPRLKRGRGTRGRVLSGIFLCVIGVLLLGMAVLSAVVFF